MKQSDRARLVVEEARIKRRLRDHFRRLGYRKDASGLLTLSDISKPTIRATYLNQRNALLRSESAFIRDAWERLGHHFAAGADVTVRDISVRLEVVSSGSWQSDLFRLATLSWSVPVSRGYGRRMRFLVWDHSAGRLLGVFALGDPVFNLRARDEWIGWNVEQRKQRLVNVMDAYVVGAVPPYSRLLGGKLVASLIPSVEVTQHFNERYGDRAGIISRENKHARLALVTTSSALGRSSLYNRLSLGGAPIFTSLGYTAGWGHFHISDSLFELMRQYLTLRAHPYAVGFEFGQGANWKIRVAKAALHLAGIRTDTLKHGIRRELFAAPIAINALDYLRGRSPVAEFNGTSAAQIGQLAVSRWIAPRASRHPQWRDWLHNDMRDLLRPQRLNGVSTNNGTNNGAC